MRKLMLTSVMIFGLVMPAMAYDPEQSDMSAEEYDHGGSTSMETPHWYGSQWQSGSDLHSEYHDNNGHTVYCQQYQAGNTIHTDCH